MNTRLGSRSPVLRPSVVIWYDQAYRSSGKLVQMSNHEAITTKISTSDQPGQRNSMRELLLKEKREIELKIHTLTYKNER
jgi:hypothetical protein